MIRNNGAVGVFINPKKDADGNARHTITGVLDKYNVNYRLLDDVFGDLGDIDFLIVMGGDGTILSAVRKLQDMDIPIFSVNIGTLGFLSEVELGEFEEALPLIMANKGRIQERLMIEAECEGNVHTAINEICVMNERRHKMVHISVYVNGDMAGRFDADGIIVSTPTGASAYSLSAGGPIVYPTTNCLVITPVCAHSITARPIVVNADDIITLRSHKGNILLAGDWQKQTVYSGESDIVIKKSNRTAKFYKLDEHGFFDRMREKLIYNIRRGEQ